MLERLIDPRTRQAPAPRGFVIYATATAGAALAAVVFFGGMHYRHVDAPLLFWMLAFFTLVGDLLPIPVPRRRGLAKVTISTAFAFAILLRFGAGPATLIYAGSSVIADLRERTAPIKLPFNAAQYVLAMAAAAAVLTLAGA